MDATDFGAAVNIVLTAALVIFGIALAAWLFSVYRKPYDDDPDN